MPAPAAIIPVVLDTSAIPRQFSDAIIRAQRSVKPLNVRINPLPLGQINGDVIELNKSMSAATARVIAFGATTSVIYGLGSAFGALLRSTVLVEKRMLAISSVIGVSQQGYKKLADGLFRIANETARSFDEASQAAEEFARQGLPLNETLKRTKDALILAKLSGIEAKEAVSNLTAAVNTFKREAYDTTTIINKLATVDAAFAVGQKDLAEAISRAGSSAQDAKLDLDELLGTVTSLQQTTARGGAVIGNALKSIFTRTNNPEVLESLRAVGVEIESVPGKTRPTLDILRDLAGKYKELSEAQKSVIGEKIAGIYQINQFKALIADLGQANSLVDQAIKTSRGASDEAINRNRELNTSLSAIAQQAGNNLTKLFAKIGEVSLAPNLKSALKTFNSFFREVGDENNGSTMGQSIGEGILSGIASALKGPGAFVALAVLLGSLKKIGSFAFAAVKDLSQLNKSTNEQQLIQGSINNLLATGNTHYVQRFKAATTEKEQQEIILSLLRQQNAEIARKGSAGATVGGLLGRTYVGSESGRLTPRRAADGYVPNAAEGIISAVDKERVAIESNVGGARGAKPKVIENFDFGNGKRGPIVANTKEVLVKGFGGGKGSAIFNPKMISAVGGIGKLSKLGEVKTLADGYIPNFAKVFRGYTNNRYDSAGIFGNRNAESIEYGKNVIAELNKRYPDQLFYGIQSAAHIPGVTYSTSLSEIQAKKFAASDKNVVTGDVRILSERGNERLRRKFAKRGGSGTYNDFLLDIASKKPFGVKRNSYEHEEEIRVVDPNKKLGFVKNAASYSNGFVPNFASELVGEGVFGQYYKFKRGGYSTGLGKKVFKNEDEEAVRLEFAAAKILEKATEVGALGAGVKTPRTFGTLERSVSRKSFGKDYVSDLPAKLGYRDSKTTQSAAIADDSRVNYKTLTDGIIENELNRRLSKATGLQMEDLHSSNYSIDSKTAGILDRYSKMRAASSDASKRGLSYSDKGAVSLVRRLLNRDSTRLTIYDSGALAPDNSRSQYVTDYEKYVKGLETFGQPTRIKSAAAGYNPLSASLDRERAITGKTPKIGYDNRVGIGVFSHDQGTLTNAVNQHLRDEPGRNLSNIKQTGVPNFAPTIPPASAGIRIDEIGITIRSFTAQQKRLLEEQQRSLLVSKALSDEELTRQERSKLTALNAAKIADELGTSVREINVLRKSNPVAYKNSGLNEAVFGAARRATANVNQEGLQERLIRKYSNDVIDKVGIFSSTTRARDKFLSQNAGSLDRNSISQINDITTQKRQGNTSRRAQALFGASFAIPFLTEIANNTLGDPNTQKGRLISGAGNALGTSLSIGTLLAQAGSLKGGLVAGGLTLGAFGAKSVVGSSAPDISRLQKDLGDIAGKIDENNNAVSTTVNAIQNAREVREVGGSPAALERATKEVYKALAEVTDTFDKIELAKIVKNNGGYEQVSSFLANRDVSKALEKRSATSASRISEITDLLPASSGGAFSPANIVLGKNRRSLIASAQGSSDIDSASRNIFSTLTGKDATLRNIRSEFTNLNKSEFESVSGDVSGLLRQRSDKINIPLLEKSISSGADSVSLIDSALKAAGQDVAGRKRVIDALLTTSLQDTDKILAKVVEDLKQNEKITQQAKEGKNVASSQAKFTKITRESISAIDFGINYGAKSFDNKIGLGISGLRGQIDNSALGPAGRVIAEKKVSDIEAKGNLVSNVSGIVGSSISTIKEELRKNSEKLNDKAARGEISQSLLNISKNPFSVTSEYEKIANILGKFDDVSRESLDNIKNAAIDVGSKIASEQQQYTQKLSENQQTATLLLKSEQKRRDVGFLGGDYKAASNNKAFDFNISSLSSPLFKSRNSRFNDQANAPVLADQASTYEKLFSEGIISPESKLADVARAKIQEAARANFAVVLDELSAGTSDKGIKSAIEDSRKRLPEISKNLAESKIPLAGDSGINSGIKALDSQLDAAKTQVDLITKQSDAVKANTDAIAKLTSILAEAQVSTETPTVSKASGFVPNFSAFSRELRDIRRGVGGARAGDKPLVKNISGLGTAVVNSGEKIVRNFLGSGKDAVFNREMIGSIGDPSAFGNVENLSSGFVPNFAANDDIHKFLKTKSGQRLYRIVLKNQGYTDKQADAFLKSKKFAQQKYDVLSGAGRRVVGTYDATDRTTRLTAERVNQLAKFGDRSLLGKLVNYWKYKAARDTLAHEETHRIQSEGKPVKSRVSVAPTRANLDFAKASYDSAHDKQAKDLGVTKAQLESAHAKRLGVTVKEYRAGYLRKELEAYTAGRAAASPVGLLKGEVLGKIGKTFNALKNARFAGVGSKIGAGLNSLISGRNLDIIVSDRQDYRSGGSARSSFILEKIKARFSGVNLVSSDELKSQLKSNPLAKVYDPSGLARVEAGSSFGKSSFIGTSDPRLASDKYRETVNNKFLPRTRLASDLKGGLRNGSQIISNAKRELGASLIAKPLDGAAGKGILRNAQNLQNLGNRNISNYLLQEQYKLASGPNEFRVHVAGEGRGAVKSFGPVLDRTVKGGATLSRLTGNGGIIKAIRKAAENTASSIAGKNSVFGVDIAEIDKRFAEDYNKKVGYEKFTSGRGFFGLGPKRYFGGLEANPTVTNTNTANFGASSSLSENTQVQLAYRDYIKSRDLAAKPAASGVKFAASNLYNGAKNTISGAASATRNQLGALGTLAKLNAAESLKRSFRLTPSGSFSAGNALKGISTGLGKSYLYGGIDTAIQNSNASQDVKNVGGFSAAYLTGRLTPVGLGIGAISNTISEGRKADSNIVSDVLARSEQDFQSGNTGKINQYVGKGLGAIGDTLFGEGGGSSLRQGVQYGSARVISGLEGAYNSTFGKLFGKSDRFSLEGLNAPVSEVAVQPAPDLSKSGSEFVGPQITDKGLAASRFLQSLDKDIGELSSNNLDLNYRSQLYASTQQTLKSIQSNVANAGTQDEGGQQALSIYKNYLNGYEAKRQGLIKQSSLAVAAERSNIIQSEGLDRFEPNAQRIILDPSNNVSDEELESMYGVTAKHARRLRRLNSEGLASGYIPNFAKSFIKRFGKLGTLKNIIDSESGRKTEALEYIRDGGLPQEYINKGFSGRDLEAISLAIGREKEALYARGISRNLASGYIFAGYHPRIGIGIGNTIDEPAGAYNTTAGLAQGINRVASSGGNPAKSGVPNYAANPSGGSDFSALLTTLNNLINTLSAEKASGSGSTNGEVKVDHNINVNASINGVIDSNNSLVQQEVNAMVEELKSRLAALESAQKTGSYSPPPPSRKVTTSK